MGQVQREERHSAAWPAIRLESIRRTTSPTGYLLVDYCVIGSASSPSRTTAQRCTVRSRFAMPEGSPAGAVPDVTLATAAS